jgi:hypothetical protein
LQTQARRLTDNLEGISHHRPEPQEEAMYSQFAPMGSDAVEFANDYRAEQIRTIEASRLAAQCKAPRRGLAERLRATHPRKPSSVPSPTWALTADAGRRKWF